MVFSATELEYIRAHARQLEGPRVASPSEVYLDNAASTRPLQIVRDAVVRAMEIDFGNPSSAHGAGRRARQALEDARDQVAALVGADRSHVVFTSGGTEANNLMLRNASASGIKRVITSAVEHSSILGIVESLPSQGIEVVILPVDSNGRICIADLENSTIDPRTLVSLQWANNETGVLQSVLEVAEIVAQRGGHFHTDASQAVGKFPLDFAGSAIEALTMTAHKVHGPQGVGALVVKRAALPNPLMLGGSQERGQRVGTENFPGIVGFGVAAEHRLATLRTFIRQTRSLRDIFESSLRDSLRDVRFNGALESRVCTTGSVTIPNVDGQALIAQLDARGIRVSQSSACTNMRPEPSYVLRAMGMTEDEAYSTIRYAMSEDSTFESCSRAAACIAEVAARLGAIHAPHALAANNKEVV